MATTRTTTKPAAKPATRTTAKPAAKQSPKATQAPKVETLVYAALLSEALGGKFGSIIQRFYSSAIAYHKKAGTTFPRQRIASEALMNEQDARAFIAKHERTSIPAGSKAGQRLFDAMMIEAQTGK